MMGHVGNHIVAFVAGEQSLCLSGIMTLPASQCNPQRIAQGIDIDMDLGAVPPPAPVHRPWGGVAGALPAYLVFLLSNLVFEVALAVVVGLPIFILVMLAPWWCLGGLMEVFKSGAWTLAYRELRAVEDAKPDQVRAVDAASLGAGLPHSQGSPFAWTSLTSKECTLAPADGLAIRRGSSC